MSATTGRPTAIPVVTLDEIGSTNDEALRRALDGAPLPFWVVAHRQTAGRGRSSRKWISLPGNLAASLALDPACPPAAVPQLALLAGVAVAETIVALATAADRPDVAAAVTLKWPNDVLIGAAKVGGILVESSTQPRTGDRVGPGRVAVIGLGLDVVASPAMVQGRAVTTLADHGIAVTAGETLEPLTQRLTALLAVWDGGAGFADVVRRWHACGMAVGTEMAVHVGPAPGHGSAEHGRTALARGRFAGLDRDGALLLRRETGEVERITFGDVTLLGTPS
jgi:BirA family biotin operon repressor/biotin-[acetyl-CoA-carboxylase] ligase